MSESDYEAQHPGPKLNDFLFILFRHKWKILLFTTASIVAAALYYFLLPPVYESEAKLLVRYVVERSAVDRLDSQVRTPDPTQTDNIIGSEVEILSSWDLAMQVAEAIGVERLLPESGGKATKADAARYIHKGLKVSALKGTDIISVTYQNSDPKLAAPVLQELVNRYFDKHLEVHRSMGAFDLVKRQTDQVREQLNGTEEELKQMRAKLGITSLAEGTATLVAELAKDKADLAAAEAELAAQQARVNAVEKWIAAADKSQSDIATHQPTNKIVTDYQALVNRITYLRQAQTELISRYTSENRMVQIKQQQIDGLEKHRRDLEEKYPGVAALVSSPGSSANSGPDLLAEKSRLVEIEAKTEAFRSQLNGIERRAKVFSELGPQVAELERRKEVQETNYKYFEASLEKAQVDETLNPSRMPNISVVQRPSPAVKASRDVKKIVLGLAGSGFVIGIGIALLIELVLDRTVKRPLEIESRLSIPLLLTIPYFGRNGQLRLHLHNDDQDPEKGLQESTRHDADPWEDLHSIRPFCEAIRDRLAFYFEIHRMTHKPKLVAVTGLSKGAGASTLAAGLAAALSEGGNEKVLLVDEPLDPKRFYDLISEFKASEFDYVIFDMPFLSETSPTLAMAGFVDKVLLVIEAGKNNRELVKRAYSQLTAARARVSAVFNKSRSYGPKWVEAEL
jgi:polysaccharide biosynthesis transport protein